MVCNRTREFDLKLNARHRRFNARTFVFWTWCAVLFGSALPAYSAPQDLRGILSTLEARQPNGADSDALKLAAKALAQVASFDLVQATKTINAALQLDTSNSYLHFFNGFIYHVMAKQGDGDKLDLAIEGYLQATRFDAENWIAHEFLGLALLEKKQYARAQSAFAETLLARPDDPVALGRMMAASYLARDAATACAVADRLVATPHGKSPGVLSTSVAVYAACGREDQARAAQQALSGLSSDIEGADQAEKRLARWGSFYRLRREAGQPGAPVSAVGLQVMQRAPVAFRNDVLLAQAGDLAAKTDQTAASQSPPSTSAPAGDESPKAPGPNTSRMVLLDVVMLSTEDAILTSRGINLLNALSLQFGSVSAAAYSKVFTHTLGQDSATVLSRAITVPALAYSLNLANANSSVNDVIARPTLAAVDGLQSEFFSGSTLNAAVVSSGTALGAGGSSVTIEKKYGVSLSVLPKILPDGRVQLAIQAARTFIKPPNININFTFRLELSETTVKANVVMRAGETLVLGGLSEKESTRNRDGVPLLQDTPLLQYLFAQDRQLNFARSVLILITPRLGGASTGAAGPGSVRTGGEPERDSSLEALRNRYADWFKPNPSLESVFRQLTASDLYREFRSGDVSVERWDRMQTTAERLRQAMGFLYF